MSLSAHPRHTYNSTNDSLLNRKEHALDIQIHDAIPSILLIHIVKIRAPRRARIRKQYIHVIRVLPHFCDQPVDLAELAAVGGDAVGAGVGGFVGEGVEGCDGGFAG